MVAEGKREAAIAKPSACGGAVICSGGEDEQEQRWTTRGGRRTVPRKKISWGLRAKHGSDT